MTMQETKKEILLILWQKCDLVYKQPSYSASWISKWHIYVQYTQILGKSKYLKMSPGHFINNRHLE